MAHAYLQPVRGTWTRLAGAALLVAAVGLTALLGFAIYALFVRDGLGHNLPTSFLVILLVLVAACGFCWQAGARLLFDRPNRAGSLFSPLGWVGVGLGLGGVTAVVAVGVFSDRDQTADEYHMLYFAAALSAWCFILAYRTYRKRQGAGVL